MTLMHFTDAETLTVESRAQDGPHPRRHFKPNGLWVSDESEGSDGWRSWCADNEYRLGRNAFAIELALDASVLTLATPGAIREFDAEFGTGDRYRVAWDRVAARWQGILITPYQWSLRLSDVDWYYPWDCASGCIWDAAAIASVTPIARFRHTDRGRGGDVLICQTSTTVRRVARRVNDPRPIEQHDARCDQHGVVSAGWPTQAAAQNAADLHAATAAYGSGGRVSGR